MKAAVKKALAKAGWSLNRVPPGIVMGFDLGRDLSLVLRDRPALVCIDAGANEGQFTDFLERNLDRPVVHAFEPASEPFARLWKLHNATPGVTLVNAGLGAESGQIDFNIYDNQTLNSFLPMLPSGCSTLGNPKFERRISVPVHSLDDYAGSAGLSRIDLLKIDTQGYEMEVLKGASRLLLGQRIATVLIEISFAPLYGNQVWAHEIIGYLHGQGLHLVDFYEKCRISPHLGWCTALFTRRETSSP